MADSAQIPMLTVLAVDDDAAQRHVLNATLYGVARVHFCATPEQALEAAGRENFDAAILDVHLRRSREDGFDVARALNEVDPCLALLLYTGDDSSEVLESALEVRALRRILKASPRAAIVQAVRQCAEETRRNRTSSRDAVVGKEARHHLEAQTRAMEISRTVADLYRGFFHGLADELTALGVTGAVITTLMERTEAPGGHGRQIESLRRAAQANTDTLARISSLVRQMTTGAGDLTSDSDRCQVGVALQALSKIFATDTRLEGGLNVIPPHPELILPVSSVTLVNALRNVVHLMLEHRERNASVTVSAELIGRPEAERILRPVDAILVLNRETSAAAGYVRFHCRGEPAALNLAVLSAAMNEPPRAGRLYALVHLSAQFGAPVICRQSQGRGAIELLFPNRE